KRELKNFTGETCLKNIEEIDAKALFEGADAGDEFCIGIVEKAMEVLGRTIAAATAMIDPQAVVLGGGVAKSGRKLIKFLRPAYERAAFGELSKTKFLIAELGPKAGIYGAAAMLIEQERDVEESLFKYL
ncbi:MAG: ROK family protein, partial [Firmicutes bacterium]|nr:ROK family protein [Bacillota bacterium]